MGNADIKIVPTTAWSAGPGCHGGCGVLAHIKDGKLVKLEGDPDHPWNQGRLEDLSKELGSKPRLVLWSPR